MHGNIYIKLKKNPTQFNGKPYMGSMKMQYMEEE